MDMSDHRVKHKSRRSSSNGICKKKKSRKHSSSSSSERIRVSSHKHSSSKEKKSKSRRRKHRTSSRESSSSDSCARRLKLGANPRQLLGERPEFCKNSMTKRRIDDRRSESLQNSNRFRSPEGMRRRDERSGTADPRENFSTMERRVLASLMDEIGKKRRAKERLDGGQTAKKSKKSRKRRSPSSSSYSSDASSSESSSTSGDSGGSSDSSDHSSSSSDGHEKRRKRKRRKRKKLAKKIKREAKRRREEKRKLKRSKEKSRTPVKVNEKEIKRIMEKVPQDRLLKDINVELADRARAMAPMTREQWEKKQSVIRRIYDDETGRQRLIKGDGEVLEEIVSRDRHMAINRKATKGDGEFFQSRLRTNK